MELQISVVAIKKEPSGHSWLNSLTLLLTYIYPYVLFSLVAIFEILLFGTQYLITISFFFGFWT